VEGGEATYAVCIREYEVAMGAEGKWMDDWGETAVEISKRARCTGELNKK
jgi:hypothetical protein